MVWKSKLSTDEPLFQGLTEISANVLAGTDLLTCLLATDNRDEAKALRKKLHKLAGATRKTAQETTHKVAQAFVTPLDRDDIGKITVALVESIAMLDAAGDFVVLYKLRELPAGIPALVEVLARCAEATAEALPRLHEISELRDYWLTISRLENEADKIYRRQLGELFDLDLDVLTTIKLKDVLRTLEDGVDAFEKLANNIEAIAIKSS